MFKVNNKNTRPTSLAGITLYVSTYHSTYLTRYKIERADNKSS